MGHFRHSQIFFFPFPLRKAYWFQWDRQSGVILRAKQPQSVKPQIKINKALNLVWNQQKQSVNGAETRHFLLSRRLHRKKKRPEWRWRGGEEGVRWKPCHSSSTLGMEEGGVASIPNDSHLSKVGNGAATELSIPQSSWGRGSWSGRGGEGRRERRQTCDLSFEQAAFGLSRCGGGRERRRTEGF